MKITQVLALKTMTEIKNVRLSRRSIRKIKKAANQTVDAAVSVTADVLKSMRKSK